MTGKRITLGLLIVLLLAGVALAGVQYSLQQRAERQIAELAESLPPEVQLSYGEVRLGFLGRDLRIDAVGLNVSGQDPVTIDRVHVLEFDRHNETPQYLHARFQGVRQDLAGLQQEQLAALQQLGYDQVIGDYEIDYRYSEQTREFELRRLGADMQGIGSLAASVLVTDVDPAEVARAPDQLLQARLRNARFTYVDHSLVGKVLSQAAHQSEISESEVIDRLLMVLDQQLPVQESPFMRELRREVETFLRAPGSLTVEASPEQPVPFMDLAAYFMVRPADAPKLLQLSVRAN